MGNRKREWSLWGFTTSLIGSIVESVIDVIWFW